MGLDIRLPLGLMFLITGALMAIYGFFTRTSAIYDRSLGINVNLIWGVVMLIFGLIMYLLGRRQKALDPASAAPFEINEHQKRGH